MRIIADNSKEIEKKVTCHNCGSFIGYLPVDIEEYNHTDYSGDTARIKSIKCPKCSNTIIVGEY